MGPEPLLFVTEETEGFIGTAFVQVLTEVCTDLLFSLAYGILP